MSTLRTTTWEMGGMMVHGFNVFTFYEQTFILNRRMQ